MYSCQNLHVFGSLHNRSKNELKPVVNSCKVVLKQEPKCSWKSCRLTLSVIFPKLLVRVFAVKFAASAIEKLVSRYARYLRRKSL